VELLDLPRQFEDASELDGTVGVGFPELAGLTAFEGLADLGGLAGSGSDSRQLDITYSAS
jgi:hypothetical protein